MATFSATASLPLRADVYEQVVQDGLAPALVVFHQVDRLLADDAEQRAVGGVDVDALADGDVGVMPADGAEVDVAVAVDVGDEEADLVAVSGEHHFGAAAGLTMA